MLWIHSLVGISHFTKFHKNWALTKKNATKSPKIPYSAMVRKMEK